MEHTTIAVDLAKSVFQVAVSHRPGRVDEERRLTRERFLTFFAQQPPATVVLEACGSAHYWARQLRPFGHTVRLLPAHDVRRYVRRNKTDRTDTKGMLEANRNEEIHPVPEHLSILRLVTQDLLGVLIPPGEERLAGRAENRAVIDSNRRPLRILIVVGSENPR